MMRIMNAAERNQPPFAVVELFSSEGCSFCPPAEAALNELIASEKESGRNVLPLATHVPWWSDGFGLWKFAKRLENYKVIGGDYSSPSAAVNGRYLKKVSHGNNFDKIIAQMEKFLEEQAAVGISIELNAAKSTKTDLVVTYSISGQHEGRQLNVVLAESGIVSKIERGENAGKTLRHDNMVREFVSIELGAAADEVKIPVKPGCRLDNCLIMAFVEDPTTFQHLGGTKGFSLKDCF